MIVLNAPVTITNNLTLDADGHAVAIDGANSTSLFQVTDTGVLTLKGLRLVNGRVKGANSPLLLGGPGGSVSGGAIQNSGGVVTALGCTFSNNAAIGGSGVVTFQGARPWQNNNGGSASGGAIFQSSGSVAIRGGVFSGNSAAAGVGSGPAPAYGGAICALSGSVTIEDTTFDTNNASGGTSDGLHGDAEARGGAIYTEEGPLEALRVRFTGNTVNGVANAPAFGGAIAAKAGAMTVTESLFSGNTCLGGNGAYYSSATSVPGYPAYGGALRWVRMQLRSFRLPLSSITSRMAAPIVLRLGFQGRTEAASVALARWKAARPSSTQPLSLIQCSVMRLFPAALDRILQTGARFTVLAQPE